MAGFSEYRRRDEVTVFVHTEVDDDYEGQGLGSTLVRGALEDVRSAGGTIRTPCPFVRSYVERHPEFTDLLAAG